MPFTGDMGNTSVSIRKVSFRSLSHIVACRYCALGLKSLLFSRLSPSPAELDFRWDDQKWDGEVACPFVPVSLGSYTSVPTISRASLFLIWRFLARVLLFTAVELLMLSFAVRLDITFRKYSFSGQACHCHKDHAFWHVS